MGAPAVYTVVVGQKPSAAQYFVNDHEEVLELCQSLRLHSTRAKFSINKSSRLLAITKAKESAQKSKKKKFSLLATPELKDNVVAFEKTKKSGDARVRPAAGVVQVGRAGISLV